MHTHIYSWVHGCRYLCIYTYIQFNVLNAYALLVLWSWSNWKSYLNLNVNLSASSVLNGLKYGAMCQKGLSCCEVRSVGVLYISVCQHLHVEKERTSGTRRNLEHSNFSTNNKIKKRIAGIILPTSIDVVASRGGIWHYACISIYWLR